MRTVPRDRFVPDALHAHAHDDTPLPIGFGQTISQPYIVALMTQLADVGEGSRVLEVGTGSGYQTAILAALGAEVFSLEIVEPLFLRARKTLASLGFENVHLRLGDGTDGWPEAAPFDAIVVTAAPETIPSALKEQLKPGGRLVIPVGSTAQDLRVITRGADGFEESTITAVRFVPMTGRAQEKTTAQ